MATQNNSFSTLRFKYKQYQDIKKQRSAAYNKAVEHEQNQDFDSFEAQFKHAQKLESVLAVHSWRKIRDAIYAGVIAAVCVGLIWILSVIKISNNKLTLFVESESILIDISKDSEWQWKGDISITDMPSLSFKDIIKEQDLELMTPNKTDYILLRSLSSEGGGSIRIGFDYDQKIDFWRDQGSLHGNFEFLLRHDKYPLRGAFHSKNKIAVSGHLRFKTEEKWQLGQITVDAVSFYQEFPTRLLSTERTKESTVLKGAIRLRDIDRNTELRAGDGLRLEGCKGQVSVIVIPEKQKIVTRFDGIARKIIWEERNLAPSLLSWVYNGQKAALFSAAFLALWGLLWRLRKWLF